jgi:hypothetical protein
MQKSDQFLIVKFNIIHSFVTNLISLNNMKKTIWISLLGFLFVTGMMAQECPLYYPDALNSQLEYKQYDKKGKLTGSSKQKITDFKKTGNGYEVKVAAESFDDKGKSLGNINLTARCENGIFFVDMKNLLGAQTMEAYKDMEMKIEGGNLEMPGNMKAGDMLKNGDMKIAFSSNGMTMMNMTLTITNRKVEAVENVTTPAGTFECYKITYDAATKMMINVKTKAAEWYSKGVGLVKSETYSTDGKLMGSNVLEGLKK